VWKEVEIMMGYSNFKVGDKIEEAFKIWCDDKDTKKIRALPLNIAWGVWLDMNLKLFENKETLPLKCVVHELNILNIYLRFHDKQITHISKEEEINKNIT
jgi:hypothetical protein